jgi:membrane protein DedA with SNARE-associated domain
VLAGVGWAIGSNWHNFHDNFRFVDYAILGLLVLTIGYLVFRWYTTKMTRRAHDPAD